MVSLSIHQTRQRLSLWQAGYRPFFLGAGVWAIAAMALWLGIYRLGWQFGLAGLSPLQWHGHEMVYGYSVAVVAGFLLTAVPNWTATRPVGGIPLFVVFLFWLGARVSALFGNGDAMAFTAVLDMLFIVGVFTLVARPIVVGKRWKQIGILVKLALLGIGNAVFYLGAGGLVSDGIHIGLYSGFYLVIALILTLGRRVIPFFMERRLQLAQPLRNDRWVDLAGIGLFLVFWGFEVFSNQERVVQVVSLLLLLVYTLRLYHWHRREIWRHSLLWVLFVSYALIVLGFALVAAPLSGLIVSPLLALHLFAIGGIGLMTCGMMSRVALGHTGRDVRYPPKTSAIAFVCIVLAAVFRALFPILFPDRYLLWITLSQWLWIAGFGIFMLNYGAILLAPRVDGKPG